MGVCQPSRDAVDISSESLRIEHDQDSSFFSRSRAAFSSAEALTFAGALVAIAHTSRLAAAQKNTVELAELASKTVGFDFAVAEECFQMNECAGYTSVYGSHVIDIEYTDDLGTPFADVCASPDRAATLMLRDRALSAIGAPGYVYEHC